MNEAEHRTLTLENERRMRDLARRLAVNAETMATTMDRAAELHESIADDRRHPLYEGAAAHAAQERRIAADEREEAIRLRERAGDPGPPIR